MDATLFAASAVGELRSACADLSWLLGRGYAEASALALVGDRHRLQKRQRVAVSRSACGDADRATRVQRRHELTALRGASLAIDGFNCIITVEAGLSGGVLLRGRDGALRDLASVHGSYRRVETTAEALRRSVAAIERFEPARVLWWLDRPVSNSGRLASMIEDATAGARRDTEWAVQLDFDPDSRLREHDGIIASSDRAVLDGCRAWVDLPTAALGPTLQPDGTPDAEPPPALWCVDFRDEPDPAA